MVQLTAHYAKLLGLCRRWAGPDAEDAVQETMLRAWQALERFEGEDHGPWLYVIARRVCIDMARRRREGAIGLEPSTEGFTSERLEAIEAWGELTERQRWALVERLSGATSAESAERLGVTVNSIDRLVGRARRALEAA